MIISAVIIPVIIVIFGVFWGLTPIHVKNIFNEKIPEIKSEIKEAVICDVKKVVQNKIDTLTNITLPSIVDKKISEKSKENPTNQKKNTKNNKE